MNCWIFKTVQSDDFPGIGRGTQPEILLDSSSKLETKKCKTHGIQSVYNASCVDISNSIWRYHKSFSFECVATFLEIGRGRGFCEYFDYKNVAARSLALPPSQQIRATLGGSLRMGNINCSASGIYSSSMCTIYCIYCK